MDLSTDYLGFTLRTPFVPSASPLTRNLDGLLALRDAGAPAVVLHSLYEEQLRLTKQTLHELLNPNGAGYARALAEVSESDQLTKTPLEYLDFVSAAKKALDIPVIANLNGAPNKKWGHYARLVEQAGADALELNLYYVPTDPLKEPSEIERDYVDTVKRIINEVQIPVAVKLGPFFTNICYTARAIEAAGAKALVIFNRFYQPDILLERRAIHPMLSLSSSNDLLLPLRWIAILRNQLSLKLAVTSGVHEAKDAAKAILAGADITMLCSTLLKHGVSRLATLERSFREWMTINDFRSLKEMKGLLSREEQKREAYERAQYMLTLDSYPTPENPPAPPWRPARTNES